MHLTPTFVLAFVASTLATPLSMLPGAQETSIETLDTTLLSEVQEMSVETLDNLLFSDVQDTPIETLIETSNTTLVPLGNPNACPANRKHTVQDKVYLMAMNQFCNRHTPTKIIKGHAPFVYTYDLTAYDGKPIRWIFKVSIDGNTPGDSSRYGFTMTNKLCKERFRGFLHGKGGGMPKVYCEWNDKRGTRDHLVLGGSYRIDLPTMWGQAVYETRKRR